LLLRQLKLSRHNARHFLIPFSFCLDFPGIGKSYRH
jgi:hypothetical protein